MAKFSLQFKREVAEKYLEGDLSLNSVAEMYEISSTTVRKWAYVYREHGLEVSVTSTPSSISARVSYHGHFHEHGHYRGQKHALHQQTLDHYSTQPAV